MSVLVLGMHRSGTSMLTRCINLLGYSVGRGRLMPPHEDNPKGFWEQLELCRVNERLLEHYGGTWCTPPLAYLRDWASDSDLQPLRHEACAAFDAAFDGTPWVWKDPRNCLTLPFWRGIWSEDPCVVFVHRHPLDVAASLQQRDDISRSHALALWEIYTAGALRGMAKMRVVSTSYRRLIRNPTDELIRISAFLNRLDGGRVRGDVRNAARTIEPKLRHHAAVDATCDDDPVFTPAQRGLHRLLNELPEESEQSLELDISDDHFLRPLEAIQRGSPSELQRLTSLLHQTQARLEHQQQRTVALEADVQRLKSVRYQFTRLARWCVPRMRRRVNSKAAAADS